MSDVVKFTITRTIVCGKTTCASEPGKFCDYVAAQRFGTRPVCTAFEGEPRLHDHDGWLQRCDACLEAEKGGE